jgi:TonB family protein
MLYASCIGALLAVAAHAAEHAAHALGAPRRGVWALAMAATLASPLLATALARDARPVASPAPAHDAPAALTSAGATVVRTRATLEPLAAIAGAAWLTSSALAALLLGRAVLLLHRRRQGWTLQRMHGVTLFVAPDAGPAVVGVRRMYVVLPEWALALDERLLTVMLRHETEHVAARDPLLLLAGGIALVLMPWNAALWWQARRLRLAVEIDCDARVLRTHGDVERYGLLLLAVAQRRQLPAAMFSPALLGPVSLLERRIAAMTARPARRPYIVAGLAVSATVVALVAACSAPVPSESRGAAPPRTPAVTAASDTQTVRQLPASKVTVASPPHGAQEVPVMGDTDASGESKRVEKIARRATPAAPALERAVGEELTRTKTPDGPVVVNGPYMEFQVEKPVLSAENSGQPRYPVELKAASVEGVVYAQFVVDTSGLALPGSLKVLKSDHELFTDAVREALPRMRFVPAEVGGRRVRQLVQQPFQFALPR